MGELEGRVALVTGSTRGIGRAMAEALAAQGAHVVVHGTRLADAEAVAAEIPGALGLGADMGDRAAIAALVSGTVEQFGRLDVLVNNAGIATRAAVTRITDEDWDRVIAVNLTGPTLAIRAAVPHMKRQGGGSIVNVISGAATEGTPGFSAYAASKGGLLGLTRTLAKELALFSIRVNALSPTALTDMNANLPPESLEVLRRSVAPVGAIADVTTFLASDGSRYVSGQVFEVRSQTTA